MEKAVAEMVGILGVSAGRDGKMSLNKAYVNSITKNTKALCNNNLPHYALSFWIALRYKIGYYASYNAHFCALFTTRIFCLTEYFIIAQYLKQLPLHSKRFRIFQTKQFSFNIKPIQIAGQITFLTD